jgi:sec-independent protein translocase protein TatA
MVLLLFSIAGSEIFFIILAIVLLFGSKKIPEIARGFGKGIREFKNATSDIQEEIRKTSREVTNHADPNKSNKKDPSEQSSSKPK